MDFQSLDQDEITRILKERLNISITKGTFTRYNQLGFILMPQKLAGVSDNNRRVGYHPFVPVELAAAFLLFKGDWLEPESEFRVGRATIQDVFLGRLMFYCRCILCQAPELLSEYSANISGFNTSIRAFIPDASFSDTISMDFVSVQNFLDFYMDHVLQPFLDTGIRDSYLKYVEDSYRITFLHMAEILLHPDHRSAPLKRIVPPDIVSKDSRPY